MADKIKLGIISDFAADTGFAAVSHQVANYLDNTGKYDIKVLGINYHGTPNKWAKRFDVWPARSGGDFLGVNFVKQFLGETTPDVIFLFQDFWNLSLYMGKIEPMTSGIVGYYPVDSPNIKGSYMLPLAGMTQLICYTQFGVDESVRAATEAWRELVQRALAQDVHVSERLVVGVGGGTDMRTGAPIPVSEVPVPAKNLANLLNPDFYKVIPHGIDTENFFKVDQYLARGMFEMSNDWYIVGNVNRNQSRKRLDLSIKSFSKFAKDKPHARLLLHSVRNDPRGWDLMQLATYYGVEKKLLLTHDIFEGKRATLEQLNLLYNSLDVMINTGGGEGWGLTSFESAALGLPQIVPNWSATKEIWEGAGLLLDVVEVRHELSSINTMQATISTDHCAELLNQLHDDKAFAAKIGEQCLQVTQRPEYKWENVGARFDEVFEDSIDKQPDAGLVAFDEQGRKEVQKVLFEKALEDKKKAAK
jgi:glycosyltransferase involved in cell wall biosynthesis